MKLPLFSRITQIDLHSGISNRFSSSVIIQKKWATISKGYFTQMNTPKNNAEWYKFLNTIGKCRNFNLRRLNCITCIVNTSVADTSKFIVHNFLIIVAKVSAFAFVVVNQIFSSISSRFVMRLPFVNFIRDLHTE